MRDFEKTKAEIIRRSELMIAEKKARARRIAAFSAVAAAIAAAVAVVAVAGTRPPVGAPTNPGMAQITDAAKREIEAADTDAPEAVENTQTEAPDVIEITETAGREELKNDPSNGMGGGGNVCTVHNPAFHASIFLLLQEKGYTSEDLGEYYETVGYRNYDPETGCTEAGSSVIAIMEYFGITRADIEDYLARNYYLIDYYYDLDAMFGGDESAFEKWRDMSWEESLRLADYDKKRFIYSYNYMLVRLTVMLERYYDKWPEYFEQRTVDMSEYEGVRNSMSPEEFDRLIPRTPEEHRALLPLDPSEFNDVLRADTDFSPIEKYKTDQGVFTSLSIAKTVRDIGISREDAEMIFEATQKIYNFDRETVWRVDFDKLYSNLDYYASLLGTTGYEYPYLVDELYLIKD